MMEHNMFGNTMWAGHWLWIISWHLRIGRQTRTKTKMSEH